MKPLVNVRVLFISVSTAVLLLGFASSASASFSTNINLTPTTTQANAHPDLTFLADFSGTPKPRSLELKLPASLRIAPAAVAAPCSSADAASGSCAANTSIGTASVTVGSGGTASGEVFMTEAPSIDSVAGVSVKVELPGGVGTWIANGSLDMKLNGYSIGSTTTSEQSQRITFDDLPLTTSSGTGIQLTQLAFTLNGSTGGDHPLVTNPSACPATAVNASVSAVADDDSTSIAVSPYSVTDCASQSINPTFTTALDTPIADNYTNGSFTAEIPSGSSSLLVLGLKLSTSIWIDMYSLGATEDMCPTASISSDARFNPVDCPAQARVGTVRLTSPVFDEPIEGKVWVVSQSPVPGFAIDLEGGGASIRSAGWLSSQKIDPNCMSWMGYCAHESVLMFPLSSIPATKWEFEFEQEGRIRSANGAPMSSHILKIAPASSVECVSPANVRLSTPTYSYTTAERTSSQSVMGCASGSPVDTEILQAPQAATSDSTPSIEFDSIPAGQADSFECRVDTQAFVACTSPWTVPDNLADGEHSIAVRSVNQYGVDPLPAVTEFVVDTVAPDAPTIVSPTEGQSFEAGDVTFEFEGEDGATFSCRIEELPEETCTSPWTTEVSESGQLTFSVTQSDAAANTSTIATRTFNILPPFNTNINLTPTTTQANAHPDLTFLADFAGTPKPRSLELKLPASLRIAPAAVATPCSNADAASGSCAANTSIGTASVTVGSGGTASGEVFMTEAPSTDSVAGVSVKVELPGGIGTWIANGSLDMKLNGYSIGSTTTSEQSQRITFDDLPLTTNSGTGIQLTQLAFTLNGSTGGDHPLVTNPSACPATAVNASVSAVADDDSTSIAVSPYSVTDCAGQSINPTFTTALDTPIAGNHTNGTFTAEIPSGSSSLLLLGLKLSTSIWIDMYSLGATEDMCPAASISSDARFNPVDCPAQARVGTVRLTSPMFDEPMEGKVWVVSKSPVPGFAIDLESGGASIRSVGWMSNPQVDPNCIDWMEYCYTETALMFPLSSIPATKWEFEFEQEGRIRSANGTPISSHILTIAPANSVECASPANVRLSTPTYSYTTAERTSSQSVMDCASGSPVDTEILQAPQAATSDNTPTIEFDSIPAGQADSFECRVDTQAFAACTSPWTVPDNLADGGHSIAVRSVNQYGVDPLPAVTEFVVDTVAPQTPTIISPIDGSSFSVGDVVIEFEGDDSSTFTCSIDDGATTECASPFQYADLSIGTHVVTVAAADAAGNTASAAVGFEIVAAVELDTVFEVTPPNVIAGSASIALEFESTVADSTFECRMDNEMYEACTSPVTLTGLEEDDYRFSMRAVDPGGAKDGTPLVHEFEVDASGPDLYFTEIPPISSQSGEGEIGFGSDEEATFECAMDGGPFESCESPHLIPSGLEEGAHTFTIRGTDSVGNVTDPTLDVEIEIDTTGPETVIEPFEFDPGEEVLQGDVKILLGESNGTDPEPIESTFGEVFDYECAIDGGEFLPCEYHLFYFDDTPIWTPWLTKGIHQVQVRAVDEAGNVDQTPETMLLTVADGSPPDTNHGEIEIERGPDPGEQIGEDFVSFDFSSTGLGEITCTVTSIDSSATQSLQPCQSPAQFDNLADGGYEVAVSGVDPSTSEIISDTRLFTVDTTPPTVVAIGAGNSDGFAFNEGNPIVVNSTRANVIFMVPGPGGPFEPGESGALILCSVDSGPFGDCTSMDAFSSIASHWFTATPGAHTVRARAVDAASNESLQDAEISIFIDEMAPNFGPIDTVVSSGVQPDLFNGVPSPTPRPVVQINGVSQFGPFSPLVSRTECSIDDEDFEPCDRVFEMPVLENGSHVFRAVVYDKFGDPDPTPFYGEFTVSTPAVGANTSIDVAPPSHTNSTEPTVEFSSDAPADGHLCRTNSSHWTACTSPHTIEIPEGQADGVVSFAVRATTGNYVSGPPTTATFILDRSSPELLISGPGVTPPLEVADATFQLSGSDAVEFECALDGGSFAPCASSVEFAGLEDGTHIFAARSVDVAGNKSTPSYHHFAIDADGIPFQDLLAPDTFAVTGPEDGATIGSSNVDFVLGATKPATFGCLVDGEPSTSCVTGEFSLSLADGSHTVEVYAIDYSANEDDTPIVFDFEIDTVDPATPEITNAPQSITGSKYATFEFDTPVDASAECRLDGARWKPCQSPHVLDDVGENVHSFEVRAVDTAGNKSEVVTTSWTVDSTVPHAPIDVSIHEPIEGRTYVSWTPYPNNFDDGRELVGHFVRVCASPATSEQAVADCDARTANPDPTGQSPFGWNGWQFVPIKYMRSSEFDIGPFIAEDTSESVNPTHGDGAKSVVYQIRAVNRAGSASESVTREFDRTESKRPVASITGGTILNGDPTFSNNESFTLEIDARDSGAGILRAGLACEQAVDSSGPEVITTDCAASQTEQLAGTSLTRLTSENVQCASLPIAGAPDRTRCPSSFQTSLELNADDLNEIADLKLYAWIEDASHSITVIPIDEFMAVDRTPPAQTFVSDLAVEDGILDAQWTTEGDPSGIESTVQGSGLDRFEVFYRVGEEPWVGPIVASADEEWAITRDVDVEDGEVVTVRVNAFDRADNESAGPAETVEATTSPEDDPADPEPGLVTEMFSGGDDMTAEVLATWTDEQHESRDHVRLVVAVYDEEDQNLDSPYHQYSRDCYETDRCELAEAATLDSGTYKVVARLLDVAPGGQTEIHMATSSPTEVSEQESPPFGSTDGEEESLQDSSGFGDFPEENTLVPESEYEQAVGGGVAAASTLNKDTKRCNYSWNRQYRFNPLRKLTGKSKLKQKPCRYGVKIGNETKWGEKVALHYRSRARRFGAQDAAVRRPYFKPAKRRSNFLVKKKSRSKADERLNVNKNQGNKRTWPLYDSFGNVKAFVKQFWAKSPKNRYWKILGVNSDGSPGAERFKGSRSQAAIKVQGTSCFASATVKFPVLVGFEIGAAPNRYRSRLYISGYALPKSMRTAIRRHRGGVTCKGTASPKHDSHIVAPRIPRRGDSDIDPPREINSDLLYRQPDGFVYTMATYGQTPDNTLYLLANTTQVAGGGIVRSVVPLDDATIVTPIGYTYYCDVNAMYLKNYESKENDPENMTLEKQGLQWAYVRVQSSVGYAQGASPKTPSVYGWIPANALTSPSPLQMKVGCPGGPANE